MNRAYFNFLLLLVLGAPAYAEYNWAKTPQSDNVVDLRTNAASSPYRIATVELSSRIAGLFHACVVTSHDAKSCKVVAETSQVLYQIESPVVEKEPVKVLPSEEELASDPNLAATISSANADVGALKAISAALEVKKNKIASALSILKANYGSSRDLARKLAQAIVRSNFQGCKSNSDLSNDSAGGGINSKGIQGASASKRYAPGMDPGSEYQRWLTERTQGYVDAYDSVAASLNSLSQALDQQQAKMNTILLRSAMMGNQ